MINNKDTRSQIRIKRKETENQQQGTQNEVIVIGDTTKHSEQQDKPPESPITNPKAIHYIHIQIHQHQQKQGTFIFKKGSNYYTINQIHQLKKIMKKESGNEDSKDKVTQDVITTFKNKPLRLGYNRNMSCTMYGNICRI